MAFVQWARRQNDGSRFDSFKGPCLIDNASLLFCPSD
jgi:hypothetical protein